MKALKTFNWEFPRGVFPWALAVASFPSTERRSMERSLGKCQAAHRILAHGVDVVDPPVEFG